MPAFILLSQAEGGKQSGCLFAVTYWSHVEANFKSSSDFVEYYIW